MRSTFSVFHADATGNLSRTTSPFTDGTPLTDYGYWPTKFDGTDRFQCDGGDIVLHERATATDARYPWVFVIEVGCILDNRLLVLVDDMPALLAAIPKIYPLLLGANLTILGEQMREAGAA